jgi:endonuclease-3
MPKFKRGCAPADLIPKLAKIYTGHPLDANNSPEPFKCLIATVLSSRTKDPVTNAAMKRLWRRARTPRGLLTVSQEEIAELIKPVGFYGQKAKHLHGLSRRLLEDFGGRVPQTRGELMELPGVGRKVANLVLAVCFDVPAICVDTHVHRISNRLGWLESETPEQTEEELERIVPVRHWGELNRVIVNHGQQVCQPVSPWCSRCEIADCCPRLGVQHSR